MNSLRHSVSNIYSKYLRSEWIRHRINYHINKRFQTAIYPGRSGVDIPSADWDTLIILDACRADLFESSANLNQFDTYDRVTSKGSATNEWLNQNFKRQYDDIVYVAGMGQPSKHKPDNFVDLIEAWREEEYEPFKDPQIVTEAARDAHDRYPNKRIIVHYLQPHTPFINTPKLQYSLDQSLHPVPSDSIPSNEVDTVWEALGKGYVDKGEVWRAYRENLETVLPEVYDLMNELSGRIIVSADHGNLFGERTFPIPVKVHGHPPGIRNKDLVTVPWAVLERGGRRDIHRGATKSSTEASSQEIEDQLRSLGYVD